MAGKDPLTPTEAIRWRCFDLTYASALLSRGLSDRLRGACVAALLLGAVLFTLFTEPYVTPFGRAARANLVEVLR